MKLIKKLLPIATIASTAIVVAPTVTSCGNFTIPEDFKPTVKQHDEEQFETEEKGTTTYFTDAAKNTEIIVQDVYWTLALAISALPELTKGEASAKIDGININTTEGLISFNFYIKEETNGTYEASASSSLVEMDYKITNIPYLGSYAIVEDTNVWTFYVDSDRNHWNSNTKVEGRVVNKLILNGKTIDNTNTSTYTIDKMTFIPATEQGEIKTVLQWLDMVYWYSYYFGKCTVK